MNTNIIGRTKDDLATEALAWSNKAIGLHIDSAQSCRQASEFLRSVKGMRSDIVSWFAPHLERAMDTKRAAEASRKALVEEQERLEAPLVAAESSVKRALLAYEDQQERLRIEEQRRLQDEARKQAEVLTLAAAASMELEANASGDVGLLEEAEAILSQPIDAPVVLVASAMPKVQGVVYRDNWRPHPDVDLRVLAEAVAAGIVPLSFVIVNMPALNAFAKATKGTQAVPGVKFYNDRQIAARA